VRRRDQGDERAARLDGDRAGERGEGCEHRVEDRPQVRAVGVLPGDEVFRVGAKVFRVAERLPHQKRLGVAGNTLGGQPLAQGWRVGPVVWGTGGDALVPGGYVLAGARLQQAGALLAHLLPGLRGRFGSGRGPGSDRSLGNGYGVGVRPGAGLAAEDRGAQLRPARKAVLPGDGELGGGQRLLLGHRADAAQRLFVVGRGGAQKFTGLPA